MGHDTVRFLFQAALYEWAELNNVHIETDNEKNQQVDPALPPPPAVTPRVSAHIIPADTFSATLGGDHEAFIGMFQMTVFTQDGTGTGSSDDIINSLKKVFRNNRRFVGRNDEYEFVVQITSPIHTPEGKQEGVEWLVHTYFEYRADINVIIDKEDFEYGLPPS